MTTAMSHERAYGERKEEEKSRVGTVFFIRLLYPLTHLEPRFLKGRC